MSTSSTDPSARTPIPPVLPAEDLSGASGDLGLFAGRLPGVREYSRSACGELVPFRRVDLDPTPASFGGGVQPAIYLCDVTGPFGEGDGSQKPRLRNRPSPGTPTQYESARAGVVTPEMAFVAERENLNRKVFWRRSRSSEIPKPGRFISVLLRRPSGRLKMFVRWWPGEKR